MPKELNDFTFEFVRETDKAILVREAEGEEFWLPKSQIEYEKKPNGNVEVTMPIWLASEKKIAGY